MSGRTLPLHASSGGFPVAVGADWGTALRPDRQTMSTRDVRRMPSLAGRL